MKKRFLIIFLLFIFPLFTFPLFTYSSVLEISVNAPIHPVTSEYIQNAIKKADQENSPLLIIKLNTPGGLSTSMREIIERILSSETPIAAYVSPSGARCASAGFYIAVSCDIFAMAPGTHTGAAHPVGVSLTGQSMDKTMEKKITQDAISYIKTLAEKRGRNVEMAVKAVRESLSYTEKEALKGNLIDLIAGSEQEILEFYDGKYIERFDGEKKVLQLENKKIVNFPMSARQKFLLTISNPNLAYILLMIGLLGLYFEFSNPGAIFPGVLGGISLLLAIFSFQILPINYVGLILILLAIGLFILEIKVQSYGILTIGGITALVLGSIMLIDAPIPQLQPSLGFILPVALGLSLIFIFLIVLAIRSQTRKVTTGKEGLIGETGIAQTDLNPEGKVFVLGEIWQAEATENISQGSRVKVIKVMDTLKVKVTKA